MAGRWVDVGEAARELNISTDAVRKRIARGSLRLDRKDSGVRVWLDDGGTEAGREAQVHHEALVEDLREQVHYLREILNEERDARRRADMIIAQLTQANAALAARVPELEAPQEPPGGAGEALVEEGVRGMTGQIATGIFALQGVALGLFGERLVRRVGKVRCTVDKWYPQQTGPRPGGGATAQVFRGRPQPPPSVGRAAFFSFVQRGSGEVIQRLGDASISLRAGAKA